MTVEQLGNFLGKYEASSTQPPSSDFNATGCDSGDGNSLRASITSSVGVAATLLRASSSSSTGWRSSFRIARRAGLHGIRLHDLRHTHASLMLRQGIHPKIVSERLGHANIGITLDTYSHITPGLQEAAALKFEEGLSRTYSQTEAGSSH